MTNSGIGTKLIAVSLVLVVGCTALVCTQDGSGGVEICIDQIDDGLYRIDYRSDYCLRDYMKTGGADMNGMYEFLKDNVTDGVLIKNPFSGIGCSSFICNDTDGNKMMCRNFDFRAATACVVTTHPSDGYESISVTTLKMFGYDGQTLDEMRKDDRSFRGAAYIPMDGVNEKGLSVSIHAVNNVNDIRQDTGKVGIFTTTVLRIILDYAATIDEAKQLISQFDLVSTGQSAYHILISQSDGKSTVAEFKGNDVYYTDTQLLTNHYLAPELVDPSIINPSSQQRYDTILSALNSSDVMDYGRMAQLLDSVAQRDDPATHWTQWSCIYDKTSFKLRIFVMADFTKSYDFTVDGPVHTQIAGTAYSHIQPYAAAA